MVWLYAVLKIVNPGLALRSGARKYLESSRSKGSPFQSMPLFSHELLRVSERRHHLI